MQAESAGANPTGPRDDSASYSDLPWVNRCGARSGLPNGRTARSLRRDWCDRACRTPAECRFFSPELRTRQTAEALGLNASVQPMLRECDYGRWAGRAFGEIVAHEPDAANSWLRDPAAAPHGGEAILGLIRRVATWLADEQARGQRSITVTHSTIIRAAIVHVMDAPSQSFWRIDIRPLSVTRLSGKGDRWNVISSGCAL
jgi:broad specificity phosphatase PhoE